MTNSPCKDYKVAYEQVCDAYNQIANFRATLLGLLPLASAGGIFLLVSDNSVSAYFQQFFPAIGFFGVIVTVGLLLHELRGIQRCLILNRVGAVLEKQLGANGLGRFSAVERGGRPWGGAPAAAALIYPAVVAAWTYLFLWCEGSPARDYWALGVGVAILIVVAASVCMISKIAEKNVSITHEDNSSGHFP